MKALLKYLRDSLLNALASWQGFTFPAYFPWWQLKRDILLGRYEPEVTKLLKARIKPGMVVFDIGANVGYFTRLLAKLVGPTGRVYAFEADEENYRVLAENTKHLPQVRALKQAVADKEGTLDFYHVRGAVGVHSLLPAEDSEKRSVAATTVDAVVAREGLERVDALKIDVEGAEPMVFAGMARTLAMRPLVVFEYTPDTSQELVAALRRSHTLYALDARGALRPFEELVLRVGKRAYGDLVLWDAKP